MADATQGGAKKLDLSANGIRNTILTAKAEEAADGAAGETDDDEGADDDDATDDDDGSDDDDSNSSETDDEGATDDDESEGDDDEESEADEEDESEEEKPKKKSKSATRKYTQFKGDGSDDEYVSNLEKGYANSSAEAIRLKTEKEQAEGQVAAIIRAAGTDSELATKLNDILKDGAGSDAGDSKGSDQKSAALDLKDPFVKDMQTRWNEDSEKEISKILEANPELLSDTKLGEEVRDWMGVISNKHFQSTGKLMSGGEAMAKAMQMVGVEDKRDKQDLAHGAKKHFTPTRKRGGGKKPAGEKPRFTPEQIQMAKNLGKDESWLAKNAV